MKIMMLSLAGVVAASAITPAPADAQRWRDHRGWHNGRYWHGDRYHYAPRGYYRGRYWNGRGWGRPRYRAHYRTVCRVHHGRYGPVRRCYRVRY